MNPPTAIRKTLWNLNERLFSVAQSARGMTSLINGFEHNNSTTLWLHIYVRFDLRQSGGCLTWTKT
jgi:hypothetical protein